MYKYYVQVRTDSQNSKEKLKIFSRQIQNSIKHSRRTLEKIPLKVVNWICEKLHPQRQGTHPIRLCTPWKLIYYIRTEKANGIAECPRTPCCPFWTKFKATFIMNLAKENPSWGATKTFCLLVTCIKSVNLNWIINWVTKMLKKTKNEI